jgi:hypothetical protein
MAGYTITSQCVCCLMVRAIPGMAHRTISLYQEVDNTTAVILIVTV